MFFCLIKAAEQSGFNAVRGPGQPVALAVSLLTQAHIGVPKAAQSFGQCQAETIQQKIMCNKMLPGACGIDALGASWSLLTALHEGTAAWRLGLHHKVPFDGGQGSQGLAWSY